MRRFAALVALAGCGRVAFEARTDGGGAGSLACPPGYTRETATSCYRAGLDLRDWRGAEAACEADGPGAHLAVVSDAVEMEIVDRYRPAPTDHVWLGFSDIVVEGTYRTVTNEAVTYLEWGANEPDGALHDCGTTDANLGVGDFDCTNVDDYVCEYDGVPAVSFAWGVCPVGYVFADQGCYREVSGGAMLTWLAAEADCEADRIGHLVVFETMAEFTAVDDLVPTIADYWIGGSDFVVEGTFRSVIDTAFTVPVWRAGEPDGGTLENCLRISMDQLASDQCDTANDYICEWDGVAPVPESWGQ